MKAEAKILGMACALSALSWSAAAWAVTPADAAPAAPETAPVKPQPAFPAPLAAKTLLLDLARAGDDLIAVGAYGDIVRSKDGSTWVQSPSPVRELLTAVQFVDTGQGWAVGHDAVILHTGDGGVHWTLQNFQPGLQAPILNLLMLDARHGFALGAFGLLKKTDDGGATWVDVKAAPITADQLHLYRMIRLGDGTLLIAAEQGTLYASSDGGGHWSRVRSPYGGSFFGALPVGDKGALIFGLRGHAYLSDDVSADVVLPAPPPAAGKAATTGKGEAGDDRAGAGDAGDGEAEKPTGGNWRAIDTKTTASLFGGARLAGGQFALVGASGEVVLVAADGGSVRALEPPTDQDLAAALPFDHGLILVGAKGAFRMQSLK
ncbi:MAG: hypothetical protein KGJ55_00080 [Gammaproteobacteria bacterium]|nr:hypothetical protein [Gammaproteobacteria bacterium]